MKYTVIINPGSDRETQSSHRTWSAAYRAAAKVPETETVEVVEIDRDGRRAYDTAGNLIWRE